MTKKDPYYNIKNFKDMVLVLRDQINEISNMSAHMDDIYSEDINNTSHAINLLKEKVLRGGESK